MNKYISGILGSVYAGVSSVTALAAGEAEQNISAPYSHASDESVNPQDYGSVTLDAEGAKQAALEIYNGTATPESVAVYTPETIANQIMPALKAHGTLEEGQMSTIRNDINNAWNGIRALAGGVDTNVVKSYLSKNVHMPELRHAVINNGAAIIAKASDLESLKPQFSQWIDQAHAEATKRTAALLQESYMLSQFGAKHKTPAGPSASP